MLNKISFVILNALFKNPIRNIVLYGIFFRIFLFFIFYSSPTFYPDTESYIELAKHITSFNLHGYNGFRTLGYPLIISILNENLYYVVFFQFILGISSMILWYKTLINYNFGLKNSFIVACVLGSFINVFFYETCILVESLVLFLMSILFYFISSKILDNLNYFSILGLSLFFSFLILVKPFYAFLPFLIFLFLVIKKPRIKIFFSRNIIILIFPLLSYFGICYINKINTNYFVSTTYFGLNLSQNCVYFAENTPNEFDWISKPYVHYREKAIRENKDVAMSIWYAHDAGAFEKYNLSFQELSFELGKFAKSAIKENPLKYLEQVVFRSWLNFWKPTIKYNDENFNFKFAGKIKSGIWYFQYIVLLLFRLFFIALIPYYIYKFIITKRLDDEIIIILIVFINSILQAIVTFGSNDRFSYPFEFIMIIIVLNFFKRNKK